MTSCNLPMVPRPSEVMEWPLPARLIFSGRGTKSVSSLVGGDIVDEQAESKNMGTSSVAAAAVSSMARLAVSTTTPSES